MDFFKRFLKLILIAVLVFVGLGVFFFFGLLGSGGSSGSGLCTNSDGHVIWYTRGISCSYVNYESCSLTKRDVLSGTTPGCTDQQKIAILQKNEIKLAGVSSHKTFAETCQEEIRQMYDPASQSYLYDQALNIFYLSWGITGKALAEACRPFISDQLYQSTLSDPNMWFSPQCDNISVFLQKVQCRYKAKTDGV